MAECAVMARTVLSMRVLAAITAWAEGEPVDVSGVCRQAGVSRKTFYKWADRYKQEGLSGFEPRSRRPKRVPNRTPDDVEAVIVGLRGELADAGLDHGATSIQWHLGQRPRRVDRVPSVATIHRVLVRHGLVEPQPKKRPKDSWRRFEAPAPNEWWQIDAMDWTIHTGVVKVFNVIDDHSRVLVRSRAVTNATSAEAWTTFCQAAQQWGVPAGVLSDNGLCFSGKLRGLEVLFETNLREAGVRPFTGRPFHPQTTGKVERFQQTLKRWLRKQPMARTLVQLQAQLDRFAQIYNHERPHQAIGRVPPIERWHTGTPAGPAPTPLEHPVYPAPRVHHLKVASNGAVGVNHIQIGLAAAYAGEDVTVITDDHYATVFHNDNLVRHLRIDHTRRYQPTGNPRGRRQPHVAS